MGTATELIPKSTGTTTELNQARPGRGTIAEPGEGDNSRTWARGARGRGQGPEIRGQWPKARAIGRAQSTGGRFIRVFTCLRAPRQAQVVDSYVLLRVGEALEADSYVFSRAGEALGTPKSAIHTCFYVSEKSRPRPQMKSLPPLTLPPPARAWF